jgi:hypothetical protein
MFPFSLSDLDNTSVTINVGGRRFETRASTICAYPDSTLACAYRHDKTLEKTMWDRDPAMFELVLAFYRDGIVPPPPTNVSVERLVEEFSFWGFDLQAPSPMPDEWPWPATPPPPSSATASSAPALLPLSSYLISLRASGHLVHVGFLWRAIRSMDVLWSAAQRGYRSLDLFWMNRPPRGTCASFVRDNLADLAWLARRDGITATLEEEGCDTKRVSVAHRSHDFIMTGSTDTSDEEVEVVSWDFPFDPHFSVSSIIWKGSLDETRFEHHGIAYSIKISGGRVAMRTLTTTPLQFMTDTRGALLRLYVVVDGIMEFTVDDGFAFPTPNATTCHLTSNAFACRHLTPATDLDSVYGMQDAVPTHTAKLVIKDATRARLSVAHVFTHTNPFVTLHPNTYSRFRLAW